MRILATLLLLCSITGCATIQAWQLDQTIAARKALGAEEKARWTVPSQWEGAPPETWVLYTALPGNAFGDRYQVVQFVDAGGRHLSEIVGGVDDEGCYFRVQSKPTHHDLRVSGDRLVAVAQGREPVKQHTTCGEYEQTPAAPFVLAAK